MSELSLVWSFVQVGELSPRPIITVGELWQRTLDAFMDELYITQAHKALVTSVSTPEEAVSAMVAALQ